MAKSNSGEYYIGSPDRNGVLEACEDARFIMGMLEGRWLADSDDAG